MEIDAINCSRLKRGRRSMLHLRQALDEPRDTTRSKAMDFGSLVHTAALEPLEIGNRYCVMPAYEHQVRRADGSAPNNPKSTGEYKRLVADFLETNSHRHVVSQDDYDAMLAVAKNLQDHPSAAAHLASGDSEVSAVWRDVATGVECKARFDLLQLRPHSAASRIVDLKTTRDAGRFSDACARFGYHIQAAFYLDGLRALTGEDADFVFVVVESEPPYAVRCGPAGEDMLELGRSVYRELLDRYAKCIRDDEWPGYDDPEEWTLPAWAMPKLTMVGTTVVEE
ncbi:MAG: PD-(D/E)XK nuclease-like domain-containing protein [Acidimicrobiia bacterium]|nr:PD-(D/E)XK nuclease-like domain-containing protein [Acidimicrobiia bacterium]